MLDTIIETTLGSFDFGFCLCANLLTYFGINLVKEIKPKWKITTWTKRVILIIACLLLSIIYYLIGSDTKLIINSAILAPVAWSWIFRPICEKFDMIYIKKDIEDKTKNA